MRDQNWKKKQLKELQILENERLKWEKKEKEQQILHENAKAELQRVSKKKIKKIDDALTENTKVLERKEELLNKMRNAKSENELIQYRQDYESLHVKSVDEILL